ncbi:MAG: ABC-type Fe3+-hydroxamate transport system substrate-binding protein [Salibacteraceae bacterium]|jgi:ABC-type Fe3+-hydroxamate transport system substrate-binding protein
MRIVSVVPSLTELLIDLGLENALVGVTRFCIHPKEKTRRIQKIGGTKNLKVLDIIKLQPDIIIANKEENSQQDIVELQKHCDVLLTDIFNLNDSLSAIEEIGCRTEKTKEALALIHQIKLEFSNLKDLPILENNTIAYLIWGKPIMLAGRNTFINNLIELMGGNNILVNPLSRYPEIQLSELQSLQPDLIFLSSEPFPFAKKHLDQYKKDFPRAKILLVDGELFSWYGSRLKLTPAYFRELHTEIMS